MASDVPLFFVNMEQEMLGRNSLVLMIFAAAVCLPTGCRQGDRTVSADQVAHQPVEKPEVVEEFWPDGQLRLRKQILLKPDGTSVNHGTYTRWHNNGRKEYEATYDHAKLHGVEIAWHKNGQKWTEQHYDHGPRHGVRRNWDEQGRLRGEEHYVKDRPHGTWTIWKGDGSIKWQGKYDHGTPLPR